MTEYEALKQSYEHWCDNLDKVRALSLDDIIRNRRQDRHALTSFHIVANALFGIYIDTGHCAMCNFHKNICSGCCLWDAPDKNGNTCCVEWRVVAASLLVVRRNITRQTVNDVIDAVGDMVSRLDTEMECCYGN